MVKQLEQMKKDRQRNGGNIGAATHHSRVKMAETYEIVALNISPDMGERILLSAERSLLDDMFPETSLAVQDVRSNVSWNQQDGRQIIRFPLNGYSKLNSVEVLTRLLTAGFTIEASTGGGVEGQQFSEYLLVRKSSM